jgi:hypothetical protein
VAHVDGDTDAGEEDLCIACINDGTAHEELGATSRRRRSARQATTPRPGTCSGAPTAVRT